MQSISKMISTQSLRKPAVATALLLGLAATLPGTAWAHRSWLMASSTQLEGKEPWVTFDAAVSENVFDLDTNAVKLEGLQITGPDGASLAPENAATGKLRSSFDLKLAKPGTYRVALVSEAVMASYKQGDEVKRWRGSTEAFAKEVPANAPELRTTRMHTRLETFVTYGKGNDTALKPRGEGLELVALSHPSELAPGVPAKFRFVLDGQPIAKLKVAVVPGGVRYRGVLKEQLAVTDAKGEFTVTWPEAGMYWLNASYPPRPEPQPGQAGPGGPGGPGSANSPNGPQGGPPANMPERRLSYSGTLEVLPQ